MSSPPEKPWKRSKLAVQSPISGNLQPPVVLAGPSESPLTSKHKESIAEIKKNSKELKISTPTVKPKFNLKKKAKDDKDTVDSSLMTQVRQPAKKTAVVLNIDTIGSSSKAIGASFFSTCDSPEIKEV